MSKQAKVKEYGGFLPLSDSEKMIICEATVYTSAEVKTKGVPMDFSSVIEFIQKFETTRIMNYIQSMDLKEVMQHPYFLAGVGVTAVIAYIMRWRLLLVTVMSITGFIYLLSYTLSQGTALETGTGTDSLMVLVGGGAFIVFLAIYLLFD